MSKYNAHIMEAIRQYIKGHQYDNVVVWCDRTTLLDVVSYDNTWNRALVDYALWSMLESGEVVWQDENHWSVCLREIANPPVEGYGEG